MEPLRLWTGSNQRKGLFLFLETPRKQKCSSSLLLCPSVSPTSSSKQTGAGPPLLADAGSPFFKVTLRKEEKEGCGGMAGRKRKGV